MINRVVLTLLVGLISFSAFAQLNFVSISPGIHASNVAPNANIEITFNTLLDVATLTAANVKVRSRYLGVIPGAISGGGTTTLVFNPTDDFRPGDIISVTFTTGIRNQSAQAPTRGHTYSFTVRTNPSESTPTVFAQQSVAYVNGGVVHDIKTIDIENDGDLDLITGNYFGTGDRQRIWTNDGSGNYCTSEPGRNAIADAQDLDGDGDKDLITIGGNQGMIGWARNDGGGVFTPIDIVFDFIFGKTLRAGDVDSDGDVDMFAAFIGAPGGLTIYRNNGTATAWPKSGVLPGNSSSSFYDMADVNGDGAMDFIVYRGTEQEIVWLDGAAAYAIRPVGTNTNYQLLTSADLDDDGDLDILSGNDNNDAEVVWFENDGNENFTARIIYQLTPSGTTGQIRVIDIDGDLDKDVNVGHIWLENNGSEVFTPRPLSIGTPPYPQSRAVDYADMDGDGDMDLLSYGANAQIYWFENTKTMNVTGVTPSNASFSVAADANITVTFDQPVDATTVNGNNLTVISRYRGIVPGAYTVSGNTVTFNPTDDLKPGDEIAVAVTQRVRSLSRHVLPKNYGFDFTIKVSVTTVPSFGASQLVFAHTSPIGGIEVGDLDLDGDLDIVSCGSTNELNWHRNNGSGIFTSIPISVSGTTLNLASVALVDQNGDGWLEIVMFATGSGTKMYMNGPGQPFTQVDLASGGTNLRRVNDFDRDGRDDIILSGGAAKNTCPIFVGGPASAPWGAGDLNGDGSVDVVAPNGGYLLSNGFLQFTNTAVASGVGSARTDIDGDGDFDMVIAGTSTTGAWYPNNFNTAAPGFGTARSIGNIGQSRMFATADFDGDGDPDLAGAGPTNGLVTFRNRINEATANFSLITSAMIAPANGALMVYSGDFNGDGKIDLVAMSTVDNRVSFFPNTGGAAVIPTVTSFTPTNGPVGTTVTITGTNFSTTPSLNSVRFNGTLATVTAATATSLTVTVPSGATTGPIAVTVGGNTGASATNFTVTVPPPTITSFDPSEGYEGMLIVIFGTGFNTVEASHTVKFNGVLAATPTFTNATEVHVFIPIGATTGFVTVEVAAGTATSPQPFVIVPPPTYVYSYDPGEGPVGTVVTITGDNFSTTPSENLVFFNGTRAEVTSCTTTTIVCTVPIGATTGPIDVETPRGLTNSSISESEFTVTGAPSPTVTGFTPPDGPFGTQVTITGTNFSTTAASNVVRFNGIQGAVVSSTNTTIVAAVPVGATTGPISVTVSGNVAASATNFTVTTPVITINTHPASSTTVCAGSTAALSVTASGDAGLIYKWKRSSTSGGTYTDISDGGGYAGTTTATLSITTTSTFGAGFYRCEVSSATAAPVLSNVASLNFTTVTPPTTNGANGCNPAAVTLTASGAANGQYRWYTTASGGTAIAGAANSTLVTPQLSATTDYYVAINDGTCESTRVLARATITTCNPPVIETRSVSTQIGGTITINLIPLITAANLDISSLEVVALPGSGASASIDGAGVLTINYTGLSFIGTESIRISACDMNARCSEQTFNIEVAGDIVVYNAVSPDGLNPIFRLQYIDVLADTRDNTVIVYNRWGDIVFEVSNYNNTTNVFAGISKSGNKLPSGTYYYRVNFASGRPSMTGYLELRY